MKKKRSPKPNAMYETQLYQQGYHHILGMDEVGRGAWAGPVTVGAVCLPLGQADLRKILNEVRDSKMMTPLQRERTAERIKSVAVAWGVGSATNDEIDDYGINPATKLAMERALDDTLTRFAAFKPDCLFLDAIIWPEKVHEYPQITMVDGDARSLTVAAASIVAKIGRDQMMKDLDNKLPHYGFGAHKGYGTGDHQQALEIYGPSPLHRTSYAPVRKLLEQEQNA